MAKSWPRARTCSPAIGTIPRPRRKHSPRTASFALAISAGSTTPATYIVGRSKELIILSGGENIFPEDVSSVYGTAAQAREVAVLERDNRLVALFVPDPEAQRARPQSCSGISAARSSGSAQLPSYARIGDFALTRQPLPRTQIGKLRRHELPIFVQEKTGAGRPEPQAAVTGADRALLETPPRRPHLAVAQGALRGPRASPSTPARSSTSVSTCSTG